MLLSEAIVPKGRGKLVTRYISKLKILTDNLLQSGGPFLEAAETFRARKAIFSSSVSENGEVYTSETSFVKRTSVHIKNT